MKILFVQKVKALVGSEKYFLELIPALEKSGIQTEFICVYNRDDEERSMLFVHEYKRRGLKIHVLKVKSDKSIFATLRFIKRIVNSGNFDLIHTHLIHADFWLALLKKFKRINNTIVSTKHGYDESYISLHGFNAKHLKTNTYFRICKFSDKYITRSFAVSDGLRNFFIDAGITTADKISTIHHGFDLPELSSSFDTKYRLGEQQLLILGRVIPFKGHLLLIDALPVIKTHFPNFKLVIAGHGDENLIAELKQRISENDLMENVVFIGYQTNIYDHLQNSDLLVVPSIAEGFGLIFLEAMNAKTPIIGFDVPATNEIIVHDKTGILIPVFDSNQLGLEIVNLLKNKDKAGQFGEAGYQRLKTDFSLTRMVNASRTFYESSLNFHDDSGTIK